MLSYYINNFCIFNTDSKAYLVQTLNKEGAQNQYLLSEVLVIRVDLHMCIRHTQEQNEEYSLSTSILNQVLTIRAGLCT